MNWPPLEIILSLFVFYVLCFSFFLSRLKFSHMHLLPLTLRSIASLCPERYFNSSVTLHRLLLIMRFYCVISADFMALSELFYTHTTLSSLAHNKYIEFNKINIKICLPLPFACVGLCVENKYSLISPFLPSFVP